MGGDCVGEGERESVVGGVAWPTDVNDELIERECQQ